MDVDAVMRTLEGILRNGGATDTARALERLGTIVRSMAADGVRREDPMRELPARLGDKWSPLLLLLLRTGNYRHAVLRRLVSAVGSEGRISQRMLTLRLRALERDGLIARRATSTQPPGVEYALTELGDGLVRQFDAMMQWVREHLGKIHRARQEFESGEARSDGGGSR